MTIGERIKKLREDRGLYQEELAKKIGVSRQAVSAWELDRTLPTIGNAIAMAKVFDCDLNDISGEDMTKRMQTKNDQEFLFLENFRKADPETKKMVMRLLTYSRMAEGYDNENPKA